MRLIAIGALALVVIGALPAPAVAADEFSEPEAREEASAPEQEPPRTPVEVDVVFDAGPVPPEPADATAAEPAPPPAVEAPKPRFSTPRRRVAIRARRAVSYSDGLIEEGKSRSERRLARESQGGDGPAVSSVHIRSNPDEDD